MLRAGLQKRIPAAAARGRSKEFRLLLAGSRRIGPVDDEHQGLRTRVGPDGVNLEQAELRRAELFGLIEDRGDGLDVISGEERQSAADRLPGVERSALR